MDIHSGNSEIGFSPKPITAQIRKVLVTSALGTALVTSAMPLAAGPEGGDVVAGQAQIHHGNGQTIINQDTARAVINWGRFNVGASESVTFNQPGADSATLNRVMGADPSNILGRITANGQVYLVNPNGIIFGASSQVNVGSLVASTANIGNEDFMSGRMDFNQPGKLGARIENHGRITAADGGFVGLVAPFVANSGVISARLGKVSLAGGDAFTVDLHGDQLISLVVDRNSLSSLADINGMPLSAHVSHSGTIDAQGGVVNLSAATAKSLLENVVNVSGVIRATSFESKTGVISLLGDSNTRVAISGTLDTSGQQGGDIAVTGRQVVVADGARVQSTASKLDGGDISIGGNWQGAGPLANARSVEVARGAVINADGGDDGTGGTVAVWSDGNTRFAGTISSQGRVGGAVEVSGKQQLDFDGDVQAAQLLLDPTNLVIDGTSGSDSLPVVPSTGDFTVKANTINYILSNGTSVTLQASQDITLNTNSRIDGRSASGGRSGGGLILDAGRDITLNDHVILEDGNFTASAGGTFLQNENAIVATGSGNIAINSATGILASNLLTTGDIDLTSSAGGIRVTQSITGLDGAAVSSLDLQARDNVVLSRGARIAGTTRLVSTAGAVTTTGATLRSTGAITLDAHSGIAADALVSSGLVDLTSDNGDITLNAAVAGAEGTVNAASAKAGGLHISANGDVSLNGAALGSAGLAIAGVTEGGRAGAVTFGNTGIFSTGAVNIQAENDILLGAGGVSTSGAITLDSSAGAVNTGTGALEIFQAETFEIRANGDVLSQGRLATSGGTIDIESATGNISLEELVTWIDNASGNSGTLLLNAVAGDVVLTTNLGGQESGYTTFADAGWKADQRPNVGRVVINAGDGVELNGLNLDGNTDPNAAQNGLEVIAGNRIVSNELIAVNKGSIVMRTTNPGIYNGIFLGNSVFSRGFDSDGTQAGKTGYAITIGGTGAEGTRGNLFLFDNTDEFAVIAEGTFPKIIVGNNIANYTLLNGLADATLVAASNEPVITIGADRVARPEIDGHTDNTLLRIGSIGDAFELGNWYTLKIQLFNKVEDTETEVSSIPVLEKIFDESDPDFPVLIDVVTTYQFVDQGVASLFTNRISPDALRSGGASIGPYINESCPDCSSQLKEETYFLSGSVVQIDDSTNSVTRMLISPLIIESETFRSTFDAGGNLLTTTNINQTASSFAGLNNSSASGFDPVGGFGNQSAGNVSGSSGNSSSIPPAGRPDPGNSGDFSADSFLRDFDSLFGGSGEIEILEIGLRPSSEADTGQQSASSGYATNVFTKKYRIAQSTNKAVCAPEDLAEAQVANSERVCAPQ